MSLFGESFSANDWFKSTYSSSSQGCVEVKLTRDAAGVRDSKNPAGEQLAFNSDQWGSFVSMLKGHMH